MLPTTSVEISGRWQWEEDVPDIDADGNSVMTDTGAPTYHPVEKTVTASIRQDIVVSTSQRAAIAACLAALRTTGIDLEIQGAKRHVHLKDVFQVDRN